MHGAPQALNDLAMHHCLVVRENTDAGPQRGDHWMLQREGDAALHRVAIAGPLSSNSGELVRDWCLAGHGIMLRSLWDIAPQLAAGELVHVLPQFAMPDADIQWIAPWRPKAPKRGRLLLHFLIERVFQPKHARAAPPPAPEAAAHD